MSSCAIGTQVLRCSIIPLVGGFCLGTGALLLPSLRPYAWAAVLPDWGTLVVVVSHSWLVREVWATCWFNLMEEYIGVKGADDLPATPLPPRVERARAP